MLFFYSIFETCSCLYHDITFSVSTEPGISNCLSNLNQFTTFCEPNRFEPTEGVKLNVGHQQEIINIIL